MFIEWCVDANQNIQGGFNMENQGTQYPIDMVLCIDQTGSMSSIIERVKSRALAFYDDFQKEMLSQGKSVDTLRVKVVGFRDYGCDQDRKEGLSPMDESPFFILPDQSSEFEAFVNRLNADGGGDEPESGLEALALAINSDWDVKSGKSRQVIVVWTDASAHPIGTGADHSSYPKSAPKNFDELTDWWEGQGKMRQAAKRLILFAPDSPAWNDIAKYWECVLMYPSKGGEGLKDQDYKTILNTIANSVG